MRAPKGRSVERYVSVLCVCAVTVRIQIMVQLNGLTPTHWG